MLKSLWIVALLSSTLFAQADGTPTSPAAAPPATPPQSASSAQPTDDLARMRQDLDRMDSLLMNMSGEIEFLRDQNLQILLRTNSQMWTILLRDMRQQLAREQQRQAPTGPATPTSPPPKTKPR